MKSGLTLHALTTHHSINQFENQFPESTLTEICHGTFETEEDFKLC